MTRRRTWRHTGIVAGGGGGGGGYSRTDNALTALWKASFSGSPWTPSAGAHGNLVTSPSDVAPTPGTAQNGLVPADFNGSTQSLTSESAVMSDLWTAAAGSLWVLFRPRTAQPADAPYNEPCLVTDTGGDYFALSFTDGGVRFTIGSGGYKSTSYVACATGAYHLAQVTWNSTIARLRVDGAAAVTVACGAIDNVTRAIRIGANYAAGGKWLDGTILEIGTKAYAATSTEEDNDRGDIDTVYGLSL